MAENLNKQPSKSILKNSSSFDTPDTKLPSRARTASKGGAKWDEMNIMATLHPPDKDYGHMKIDEPKTPYNYEGLELDVDSLDADTLAEKIRQAGHDRPKALRESDESEEDDETPEEKAAKKDFEQKRKKHYNEFYAVKLARKLLEKEDNDDDDDDDEKDADEKLKKSQLNAKLNSKATRAGSGIMNITPCKQSSRSKVECKDRACMTGTAAGGTSSTSRDTKTDCYGSRHCRCMGAIRKIYRGYLGYIRLVQANLLRR